MLLTVVPYIFPQLPLRTHHLVHTVAGHEEGGAREAAGRGREVAAGQEPAQVGQGGQVLLPARGGHGHRRRRQRRRRQGRTQF